jgi:hypothetical protein
MILKVRASARLNPPTIVADEPQSRHYKADPSAALEWSSPNYVRVRYPGQAPPTRECCLAVLGNGKVSRLYRNPVIGLRRVLSDEEQIRYFLVDELVITLNVFLIDIFHLLTARIACSSRPIPNGCRITVLTTPPVESKLPQFRYSLDMMGRSLFRIIRGLGYARRRAE